MRNPTSRKLMPQPVEVSISAPEAFADRRSVPAILCGRQTDRPSRRRRPVSGSHSHRRSGSSENLDAGTCHGLTEDEINRTSILADGSVARRMALSASKEVKVSMHASARSNLPIRSGRVQNTRSEAWNLPGSRTGRVPGTCAIACRYRVGLPDLVDAFQAQGRESPDLVETMINGNGRRDPADLPLDLAIQANSTP